MNSVPCPGCGLPREAELVGRVACPVCADADPTPPVESRRAPAQAYDPTRGLPTDVSELNRVKPAAPRRSWSPVPLLFVAGLAAGALGLWGWQSFTPSPDSPTAPEVAVVLPQPAPSPSPKPVPSKPLEVAPMPRMYVAVAPMPHSPFRPPPPPRVTRVDHPNAVYTPQVPPGATVTLKGKAKELRVPPLERGATLDATELEVESVFVGRVESGSKLKIGAVKGVVTFQKKIDGGSTVEVNAPKGTVRFAVPTSSREDGSRIAGGSVVRVTARFTTFLGQIAGRDTLVAVTVTRGGALGFVEMDGPCRLEYRKADREDPDPTVAKGKVAAAARLARVE
jgi:hypothetical protein